MIKFLVKWRHYDEPEIVQVDMNESFLGNVGSVPDRQIEYMEILSVTHL